MQFFIYFSVSEKKPMSPPTPEGYAKMGQLMQEGFEAKTIVATGQLPKQVTEVSLEKGEFSISDGPFIEGKEFIPGFTIIEVNTKEEALAWAKRMRDCMGDGVMKIAQLNATNQDDIKIKS